MDQVVYGVHGRLHEPKKGAGVSGRQSFPEVQKKGGRREKEG